MTQNVNEQMKEYGRKRRFRSQWTKALVAMACVVVFCTTYALILPAITLTQDTVCGMDEHTHGQDCWEQVLVCEDESSEHVHTEDCYESVLTCEVPEHTHSESCYEQEETEPVTEGQTEAETEVETEPETTAETEAPAEEKREPLVLTEQTVDAAVYTDAGYTSLSSEPVTITLKGLLPEGVTVKAYPVEVTLDDTSATVVEAYDIGLFVTSAEGEETEYEPESPVAVTITSEKLKDVASVNVYHIDDADDANPAPQPELVTDGIAVGEDNVVTFNAERFSTYVLADAGSEKESATDDNDAVSDEPIAQAASDTVTLTFNRNSGSETAPSNITGNVGDTVTLPTYSGTRNGYTFVGWTETQDAATLPSSTYGKVYSAGAEYTLESSTTLYAVWQSNSSSSTTAYFYIRLDGTIPYEPGSYEASAYTVGIQITNAITVQYWVTDSAADKSIVENGNCVDNDVYAVLNSVPSDSLIAMACKDSNVTYDPDTQYILWYVQKYQALGSSAYNSDGELISTNGNGWHIDGVILDRTKVTISYDPNVPSGVTTIPDVPLGYQVVEGTEVSIGESGSTSSNDYSRATPSIAGYTFLGWNTKPDGSGTSYSNNDTLKLNENMTLYAQWSSTGNALQLKKVDSSGSVIEGAKFTILAAGSSTADTFAAGTYMNYRIATNTVYTITEQSAPTGYTGLTEPFHFIVKSDGSNLKAYLCDKNGAQLSSNPSDVTLTYSNNMVQIDVMNTRNTMNLTLVKVDAESGSDENWSYLPGAEFTLTNSEKAYYAGVNNGVATWSTEKKTFNTGDDGQISLSGLPDGTYVLTEVTAPDGYNLLTDSLTIVISGGEIESVKYTTSMTELDSDLWSNGNTDIDVDGSEGEDGGSNVTTTEGAYIYIKNSAGATLPNTGGMGTTMYTLSGLILMAIATAGCLMYSGRKRKRGGAR